MASQIGSLTLTTKSKELMILSEWAQVTLTAATPGVRISTQSGDDTGMLVGEYPLTLVLGPGDRIYARGIISNAVISFCIQSLPWVERAIMSAARALGF